VNPRLLDQLISGVAPAIRKAPILYARRCSRPARLSRQRSAWDLILKRCTAAWIRPRYRYVAQHAGQRMFHEPVTRAKLAALDLRKLAKRNRMGW